MCSFLSWHFLQNNYSVAAYVGRNSTEAPSDFDDPSDSEMYNAGRWLHCVVRSAANMTSSRFPPTVRLHEYEDAVFRGKPRKAICLDVSDRALASYFRVRTRNCHRDLVDKYWRECGRFQPLLEDVILPGQSFDVAELTQVSTAPKQILYEIHQMPQRMWRSTFQTVALLIISGVASDTETAYNKIQERGWPEHKTRDNLKSRVKRGKDYLLERVTDLDFTQLSDLEVLCRDHGLNAGIPWLISDPEDQAKFATVYREDL